MDVLIRFPWLAALPALVLVVLHLRRANRASVTAAVLWLAYGGYEWFAVPPEANIRVDLVLIYPALFLITGLALLLATVREIAARTARQPEESAGATVSDLVAATTDGAPPASPQPSAPDSPPALPAPPPSPVPPVSPPPAGGSPLRVALSSAMASPLASRVIVTGEVDEAGQFEIDVAPESTDVVVPAVLGVCGIWLVLVCCIGVYGFAWPLFAPALLAAIALVVGVSGRRRLVFRHDHVAVDIAFGKLRMMLAGARPGAIDEITVGARGVDLDARHGPEHIGDRLPSQQIDALATVINAWRDAATAQADAAVSLNDAATVTVSSAAVLTRMRAHALAGRVDVEWHYHHSVSTMLACVIVSFVLALFVPVVASAAGLIAITFVTLAGAMLAFVVCVAVAMAAPQGLIRRSTYALDGVTQTWSALGVPLPPPLFRSRHRFGPAAANGAIGFDLLEHVPADTALEPGWTLTVTDALGDAPSTTHGLSRAEADHLAVVFARAFPRGVVSQRTSDDTSQPAAVQVAALGGPTLDQRPPEWRLRAALIGVTHGLFALLLAGPLGAASLMGLAALVVALIDPVSRAWLWSPEHYPQVELALIALAALVSISYGWSMRSRAIGWREWGYRFLRAPALPLSRCRADDVVWVEGTIHAPDPLDGNMVACPSTSLQLHPVRDFVAWLTGARRSRPGRFRMHGGKALDHGGVQFAYTRAFVRSGSEEIEVDMPAALLDSLTEIRIGDKTVPGVPDGSRVSVCGVAMSRDRWSSLRESGGGSDAGTRLLGANRKDAVVLESMMLAPPSSGAGLRIDQMILTGTNRQSLLVTPHRRRRWRATNDTRIASGMVASVMAFVGGIATLLWMTGLILPCTLFRPEMVDPPVMLAFTPLRMLLSTNWLLMMAGASAVGVLGLIVLMINQIAVERGMAEGAWANIDVMLGRRRELLPPLVEATREAMQHDERVLRAVAERSATRRFNADVVRAEEALDASMSEVRVQVEGHPELKSNRVVQELMSELSSIESRIADARSFYNSTASEFNRTLQTVPWFPFTVLAGQRELPLWHERAAASGATAG